MENITYKNSNVNRERQSKKFTCGMVEKIYEIYFDSMAVVSKMSEVGIL